MSIPRIVLRLPDRSRRVLDPAEVFFLEAAADDTLVRLRAATPLRDVRTMAEVERLFAPHGFFRIHTTWVVNLRRIRAVRPRKGGADWEVVMESPVNRVLPVGRGRLAGLWEALEG